MQDNNEQYEWDGKHIRNENRGLLEEFTSWLKKRGLSSETVNRHINNIDFYINDFLLNSCQMRAAEGIDEVSLFLGAWFIRKAMWSSEASIKSISTSLKKFYEFMHERGSVSAEEVQDMKNRIKKGLRVWIATLKRFDDTSIDFDEVWQL